MTLVPFADLLAERRAARGGLGAFTCYDLETARGVLEAACGAGAGVVLMVSGEALAQPGGAQLVAALVATAARSPARACVQLDHVASVELVATGVELGCGVVMADGSRLPYEDNVAFVAEAARLAARTGATVEAELGHVGGDEDVAVAATAGALTDPQEAAAFVAATGAACLAVSIGNVHGRYAAPPALDWPRLEAIRRSVAVPLSLHGASGLPDADVRRAIGIGVTKVNVNTELRRAYLAATASALREVAEGGRILELHRRQTAAMRTAAARKLRLYAPGETAVTRETGAG